MKKFLISIDTEGDNLWLWKLGDKVTTENAKYLPRFQNLCDRYGFKPTFLTNFEMASDSFFVSYFKEVASQKRCEIGMHLHAWNNPPEYELSVRKDLVPGAPYLIEYPFDIMESKIEAMTNLLIEKFGIYPITHRAGRWATDENYIKLLKKYGYICDCSFTPGKDWSKAPGQSPDSFGTDYSKAPLRPFFVNNTGILEVPVTVREDHRLRRNTGEGIRKSLRNHYRAIKGQGKIWLRPDGKNLNDLLYLSDQIAKSSKDDYLMFMLHSSELMPGGCDRFNSEEKIEKLYSDLELLFEHISETYEGETIGEYAKSIIKNDLNKDVL